MPNVTCPTQKVRHSTPEAGQSAARQASKSTKLRSARFKSRKCCDCNGYHVWPIARSDMRRQNKRFRDRVFV